ncbi:MAG: phosphoesterase, partial [Candidatus Bathyarchaeia archaeon]
IRDDRNLQDVFYRHFDVRLGSPSLIILPSFNEVLGGIPINLGRESEESNNFIGPILRSNHVDIENAEAYLLDGTFLGNIKQIQTLGF